MAFKGFKKTENSVPVNHFDEVAKEEQASAEQGGYTGIYGRPVIDEYKKQNKRVQFYISQEMIDTLSSRAKNEGCKDITAYAKKLLVDMFEEVK